MIHPFLFKYAYWWQFTFIYMKKNIEIFLKKRKTYLKNLLDTIIPTSSTGKNNSKTIFFITCLTYMDCFFTYLINSEIIDHIKPY